MIPNHMHLALLPFWCIAAINMNSFSFGSLRNERSPTFDLFKQKIA